MITDADVEKLKKTFVTHEVFDRSINDLIDYIHANAEATKHELREEIQLMKNELRAELNELKQDIRELKEEIMQIKDMMYVFMNEIKTLHRGQHSLEVRVTKLEEDYAYKK
jgi:septal ring factor EnvC (AmiA/AmiB activator)